MSELITIKLTNKECTKFLALTNPLVFYDGFLAHYFTREIEKMLGVKIQLWQRILKRIIMIGFLFPGPDYLLEGEFMRIHLKSPMYSAIYVLVEE